MKSTYIKPQINTTNIESDVTIFATPSNLTGFTGVGQGGPTNSGTPEAKSFDDFDDSDDY
jgi:hypothetical protein